jgi:hypothetical protein
MVESGMKAGKAQSECGIGFAIWGFYFRSPDQAGTH